MIREEHKFTAVCDACGDEIPVDSEDGGYTASHPAHWSHLRFDNAEIGMYLDAWVCCVSCAVTMLKRPMPPND